MLIQYASVMRIYKPYVSRLSHTFTFYMKELPCNHMVGVVLQCFFLRFISSPYCKFSLLKNISAYDFSQKSAISSKSVVFLTFKRLKIFGSQLVIDRIGRRLCSLFIKTVPRVVIFFSINSCLDLKKDSSFFP